MVFCSINLITYICAYIYMRVYVHDIHIYAEQTTTIDYSNMRIQYSMQYSKLRLH